MYLVNKLFWLCSSVCHAVRSTSPRMQFDLRVWGSPDLLVVEGGPWLVGQLANSKVTFFFSFYFSILMENTVSAAQQNRLELRLLHHVYRTGFIYFQEFIMFMTIFSPLGSCSRAPCCLCGALYQTLKMQRWVLTPGSPLRTGVHREALMQCKNCCHVYGWSAMGTQMRN